MARVSRTEDERLIIAYHIRQRTHPTNYECAERFGVPASQWSAWASGKRTPRDDRLQDIAMFLKCSVEDLKQTPPNWAEEKAKFLKDYYQKKGAIANAVEPETARDVQTDDGDDDDTDNYVKIVTALAKVQAKFNKGQIPAAKYESSMKSIKEFIDFSYRDIAH